MSFDAAEHRMANTEVIQIVILDIHPIFTSIIILSGWKAKTVAAGLVSSWVGGDELTGEAWRTYSIP
jgi:hypothetical protein